MIVRDDNVGNVTPSWWTVAKVNGLFWMTNEVNFLVSELRMKALDLVDRPRGQDGIRCVLLLNRSQGLQRLGISLPCHYPDGSFADSATLAG
jgi:hypothetical protein